LAAVAAGTLAQSRLDHARKLERELLHQRSRVDVRLRSAQAQERRAITRSVRSLMKTKGKG
jgi:hypothetical protein